MALHIDSRAREAAIVTEPNIGLLIMGRKRAGFDPQWGAAVRDRVEARLAGLPWSVTTPSRNIADSQELSRSIEECRKAGVTVLILVQPTISDGRLAPLLAREWVHPPVMWATPEKPEGRMISANSLVGTHVMSATLRGLGHPLEFIYGDPDDADLTAKLNRAVRAVHAAVSLRGATIGLVGAHAPGFVDFHADPVFLGEELNSHLYHSSSVELIQRVRSYDRDGVAQERSELEALSLCWSEDARSAGVPAGGDGPETDELGFQARYLRAFRELFSEQRLDLLAFRCWPDLPSEVGHWPYLALALMVSQGYPIAMEGDVDGALCARLAESAGIGPVYLSDWLEHDRGSVAIWHTGAAPFQLTEAPGAVGGPQLSVQFNNKKPTVVDGSIRAGMDATLFRLWRFQGAYFFTVIEGRTEPPDRDRMATNGRFVTDAVDVRAWFEERLQAGMPHHVCVVEGRHAELLSRVARLSGWVEL